MTVAKKEINSKIIYLKKVKDLKNHNDNWELEKLITTYSLIISLINTNTNIDIKKLATYLKSLEDKFIYFINHSSQKIS